MFCFTQLGIVIFMFCFMQLGIVILCSVSYNLLSWFYVLFHATWYRGFNVLFQATPYCGFYVLFQATWYCGFNVLFNATCYRGFNVLFQATWYRGFISYVWSNYASWYKNIALNTPAQSHRLHVTAYLYCSALLEKKRGIFHQIRTISEY